jgi:septal ring factor EnvC (AmiA/AmiB activator)
MSVPNPPVSPDPAEETTAELPVLDVAEYESRLARERLNSTDTWVAPELPRGATGKPTAPPPDTREQRTRLEEDLRALTSSLRDFEERLAAKGERLKMAEREMAGLRQARIAVEARVEASECELTETRARLTEIQAAFAQERTAHEGVRGRLTEQDNALRAAQARERPYPEGSRERATRERRTR